MQTCFLYNLGANFFCLKPGNANLEILRFLELDKTIFMIETKPGSLAIDVPDDIQKVEERLKSIK